MQGSRPLQTLDIRTRARRAWSRPAQKVAMALGCCAGIVAEPHNPIQVPGHRAIMWLTLLLAARLFCGPGWSTAVGAAAMGGALLLARSPHGVWTVAQYGIAGILLDGLLAGAQRLAETPLRLMALGAGVEVAVGWIAPLGQSLVGGVGLGTVWRSAQAVGAGAFLRLFALDAAFGAGAGLLCWGLTVAVAARSSRRAGIPAGVLSGAGA